MALKHRLRGATARQRPGSMVYVDPNGVRHLRPWTPTQTQPPPGSYDPALDASLGRAQRGYGDLKGDYAPADGSQGAPGRLTQRAQDDYNLGVAGVTGEAGSYTRSLSDLLRDRARAAEDFDTARTGVNRNADRQLSDTALSFRNLAAGQADQQNASGQAEGGAALQAQEKRGVNQGRIDTRTQENRQIGLSGIQTQQDRYTADSSQQETRLGENRDHDIGELGLGYQRYTDDSAEKLARAGRELGFFGQDTTASKVSQAKANGWVAQQRPKNEHVDAQGPYRIIKHKNGRRVKVRPDGRVERV